MLVYQLFASTVFFFFEGVVASTVVERFIYVLKIMNTILCNQMGDEYINNCLVTYNTNRDVPLKSFKQFNTPKLERLSSSSAVNTTYRIDSTFLLEK